MPCVTLGNAIISISPWYRLRLDDGRHVFMDWHRYFGPTFYRDRAMEREIEDWYDDPAICRALEWFVNRGKRA